MSDLEEMDQMDQMELTEQIEQIEPPNEPTGSNRVLVSFILVPMPGVDGAPPRLRPLLLGVFPVDNDTEDFEALIDRLFHQHRSIGAPPASKTAIESLQDIVIHKDIVSENIECSVCKCPFEIDDKATEMPCKHLYHEECLLPWLKMHNTCPICRYEIEVEDEEYEVDRKNRMENRQVWSGYGHNNSTSCHHHHHHE
mmetsp:Transcript_3254/g.3597  ORF Transcript_3254/g.3597 Transcript_3254/m.3597 type:complete len:197 (-) Transcript_3254:120-710(-)